MSLITKSTVLACKPAFDQIRAVVEELGAPELEGSLATLEGLFRQALPPPRGARIAQKRSTEVFYIDVPGDDSLKIIGWGTLSTVLTLAEGSLRIHFSNGGGQFTKTLGDLVLTVRRSYEYASPDEVSPLRTFRDLLRALS